MTKRIKFLNPESAKEEDVVTWKVREAARGIIVDQDDKIALLYVSKNNYYKLPGGGIDDGEDRETAFKRECLEEIGCDVEIISEIGVVEEWRKLFSLRQISYCYVEKVLGKKGKPNFTEYELLNGFEVVWEDKQVALEKLKSSKAFNLEGEEYIKPRDIAIVEVYLSS